MRHNSWWNKLYLQYNLYSIYSITRDRGGPRGGKQRGPTGHGPVGPVRHWLCVPPLQPWREIDAHGALDLRAALCVASKTNTAADTARMRRPSVCPARTWRRVVCSVSTTWYSLTIDSQDMVSGTWYWGAGVFKTWSELDGTQDTAFTDWYSKPRVPGPHLQDMVLRSVSMTW